MDKVLVIGGGGYVGSELVPQLIATGKKVRVLDTFWYGSSQFDSLETSNLDLVKADMRDSTKFKDALSGVNEVIHLACISNDPSFDLNPELGKSVNLDSFLPIVKAIKDSSVERFIYASSSSVYGVREEENITEDLALDPLTDYSKYKAKCEEIMLNEFDNETTITIARPATVCGYSSRQRFDLVVNILTAHALLNRQIKVFGGSQYRPNLHIKDMVRAYIELLSAERNIIHKEIFNIGSKNLTVTEIAEAVQKEIDPNLEINYLETNDPRSYRVDSTKIRNKIGFSPEFTVNDAVADLKNHFNEFKQANPLQNSKYINILKMKELKLG